MEQFHFSEILVIIFSLTTVSEGTGKLVIRFNAYDNPKHRLYDDTCCEGMPCTAQCDNIFKICITEPRGSKCSIGYTETKELGNDKIVFKDELYTGMKNPVEYIFKKWTGSATLLIDVWDLDSGILGRNDYVAKLEDNLVLYAAQSKAVSTAKAITISGKYARLTLEYRVYCDENYLLPTCEVYCINTDNSREGHYTCDYAKGKKICLSGWHGKTCLLPIKTCFARDNTTGHFKCDPNTGNKICLPGWIDEKSNCTKAINKCLSNPCRNNGKCRDLINNYMCDCPVAFTGKQCETKINPCIINQCHNGGKCINDKESFICQCISGYTGEYCESVIYNSSSNATTSFRSPSFETGIAAIEDTFLTQIKSSIMATSNKDIIQCTSERSNSIYIKQSVKQPSFNIHSVMKLKTTSNAILISATPTLSPPGNKVTISSIQWTPHKRKITLNYLMKPYNHTILTLEIKSRISKLIQEKVVLDCLHLKRGQSKQTANKTFVHVNYLPLNCQDSSFLLKIEVEDITINGNFYILEPTCLNTVAKTMLLKITELVRSEFLREVKHSNSRYLTCSFSTKGSSSLMYNETIKLPTTMASSISIGGKLTKGLSLLFSSFVFIVLLAMALIFRLRKIRSKVLPADDKAALTNANEESLEMGNSCPDNIVRCKEQTEKRQHEEI